MIPFAAVLMAQATVTAPAGPPSAAPVTGYAFDPAGSWVVTFVPGDVTSYTRCYDASSVLVATVDPAVSIIQTGVDVVTYPVTHFTLKHYKNGQESAGTRVGAGGG